MKFRVYKILLVLVLGFLESALFAQELEPHSLSAMPTGGNFAIASYGYSSGNILVDNSLPIEDLNAQLNNFVFAYARSFKLFNRLSKFDVIVPYSFASFTGVVSQIDTSTTRSGLADPLLRFSIILIGAKPLSPAEYIKREQQKFKLGASVRLRLPLGEYDNTKLINLGANRFGVRLGLAGSYSIRKKLILEGHLTSWFFTENKEFFNGNSIKQKPLLNAQFHATYIFKPGVWIAGSLGRSGMGETIVNGVEKDDLQKNSRYGLAFAYRLSKNSALKIAFTSGISTRYGANFTTLLVAYQFMWFYKS